MNPEHGYRDQDPLNRRLFLKYAGAVAVGFSYGGPNWASGAVRSTPVELRVKAPASANPVVARAFSVLKKRIEERSAVKVVESNTRPHLILALDDRLPAEAFRLDDKGRVVKITANSPRALVYAIGKFLRTSQFTPTFKASRWRGVSIPQSSLRGLYFASHFHNWYVQASESEIRSYLEDQALWGVNVIMVIFPMINLQGWNDPAAAPAMEMVRKYARIARELNIHFATGINNTMFIGAPANLRAKRLPDPTGRRGNSGHPICPSNPEGHAYLLENAGRLYAQLQDVGLDFLVHWPYDEGGCACDQCQPWGSNGYLKLSRDFTNLGRGYFPQLKTVLSTWMFDTPPEGEWQGLTNALSANRDRWIDYILADAHEDFPRYPLEVGVPGQLPLLNFPEISMWGNSPWGGLGANPLPARFQRLWDQVKQVVRGGFPYSEGIYEDLNKAIELQFYWDPQRTARATLREYLTYEFGPEVVEKVLSLIELLEKAASSSYRKEPVNTTEVQRALQLAEDVNSRLSSWARLNWRWELLYLRAVLDRERFIGGGLNTARAEAALLRLIELYHCQIETEDPYHHRVRPPLARARNLRGTK